MSKNRLPTGRFAPGTSGNPAGRPARADDTVRNDAGGWVSLLSGYNTSRDKRIYFNFEADVVTDLEARELWRGDDVSARVIETLPSEALRGGYEVKTGDKESAEAVHAYLEEIDADCYIRRASEYERAYGGAILFPQVNDGQRLDQPLNLERARAIEATVLYEPREARPMTWLNGKPELWRLQKVVEGGAQPPSEIVHASRLIHFPGVRVTEQNIGVPNPGHGDSILTRMRRVLRDFGIAWEAAGALLVDFSQGVFTMKNLTALLAQNQEAVVRQRLQLADLARSTLKMMVVDAEDGFERKSTPMSGLPDLLDRFGQRLSAACGMPITKLLGTSAAGLNATGEGDEKNWHAVVAAFQKDDLQKPVERYVEMVLRCKDGPTGGREPDTWSIEWHPLAIPSAKEEAETRAIIANTDEKYVQMGAVTADQVAKSRWGGDTYSAEMQVEIADEMDAEPTPEELAGAGDIRDPNAGAGGAVAPGGMSVQSTAMNGAQVAAMVDVVVKTGQGMLSRESARAILTVAFPVDDKQALAMLGPESFKTPPPAPPPAPFGGGPKPPPPESEPSGGGGPPEPDSRGDAAVRFDRIEQRGGRWVVLSLDGGKVLGTYDSREEAVNRLRQIEYYKSRGDAEEVAALIKEAIAAEFGTVSVTYETRGDAFNPDQPRDERGRWGEGGGGETASTSESGGGGERWTRESGKDTKDTYFRNGQWSPDRVKIHEAYKAKVVSGVPKREAPTVFMTGGGPASGKSAALLENRATGIPTNKEAAHVDPDSAKTMIPEYQDMVASGDQAAGTLAHEESAHMSKEAVKSSIEAGHDVVYDSSGDGGIDKLEAKVQAMRDAGAKRVEANYATVDVETAIARSDARGARTGRYVPHDYLRAVHADVARTSVAAIERGTFDSMKVWDTSTHTPQLIATYDREKGLEVLDKEAWDRHVARGK